MSENATPVKTRPRLGGWTRTGIVASVLWALGAGIVTRIHDVRTAHSWSGNAYRLCVDEQQSHGLGHLNLSECDEKAHQSYQDLIKDSWRIVAIIAFGPLPFFWFLAWGIRATYRWVRRGFNSPPL
jgi:hypothetical protein